MIVIAGYVIASQENRAEMLRIALEHVHRSRMEEGCLEHGVYADAENPLKLHFFERWADEAVVRKHFAVPESRAFVKQLRALAAEAGEMCVLKAERAKI
jgi:quinol monooxygenase YgiN